MREQLDELISKINPNSLKQSLEELHRGLPKYKYKGTWGINVDVLFAGTKILNTWGPPQAFSDVYDGVHWIETINQSLQHKQVNIFKGKQEKILITKDRLCFIPSVRLMEKQKLELRLLDADKGQLGLLCGEHRFRVDPATGFVSAAEFRHPAGVVYAKIWQHHPQKATDGLLLPAVRIETRYSGDGTVSLLDIYELHTWRLNIELSDDAFAVAAPHWNGDS
jgi:hypothetical protein